MTPARKRGSQESNKDKLSAPHSARRRIDQLLVETGRASSRQRAQALIMGGRIFVDGRRVDKAGAPVSQDAHIEVQEDLPYVSRGGLKLEAALKAFAIDPTGLSAMDVGASTGGFTDCLLKHGAASVLAVDVGYGQLDWTLRRDERVSVLEKTNIRHLEAGDLADSFDLIVIDVSFISLRIVLPAALKFLKKGGVIIALIKPQFEVGRGEVEKGGIIRDAGKHERVIKELSQFVAEDLGLSLRGVIPSPIAGARGNREFLLVIDRP